MAVVTSHTDRYFDKPGLPAQVDLDRDRIDEMASRLAASVNAADGSSYSASAVARVTHRTR